MQKKYDIQKISAYYPLIVEKNDFFCFSKKRFFNISSHKNCYKHHNFACGIFFCFYTLYKVIKALKLPRTYLESLKFCYSLNFMRLYLIRYSKNIDETPLIDSFFYFLVFSYFVYVLFADTS